MADRTKFVLGLKADDAAIFSSDDSDGNFFSSDDEGSDGLNLFSELAPLPPKKAPLLDFEDSDDDDFDMGFEEDEDKNKISNFMDCSKKITELVNQFSDLKKGSKDFSTVYLVPETPATSELTIPIQDFLSGSDSELNIDTTSFDMNISCQIDMIRYTKNKEISLKQYEDAKLDLRISSLLWYIFSDTPDNGSAAFYCIRCLEDYAKFATFAPVAILYKEFTIRNVVERLAKSICNIFPKHPILESVIHSLATIDNVAKEVLEKIKEEEKEKAKTMIDDDSDEMSDSFFASLKQMAKKKSVCTIRMAIDDTPKNPLDIAASPAKIEKIEMNPPPMTVTYTLDDGTEQLGLQHFLDWIISFNPKVVKTQKKLEDEQIEASLSTFIPSRKPSMFTKKNITVDKELTGSFQSYLSSPLFQKEVVSDDEEDQKKEYDEHFFYSLFPLLSNIPLLLQSLPNQAPVEFFPLYYPTLEFINQTKVSTAIKKGCPYPSLIEDEFNAHSGLKEKNSNVPLRSIDSLISNLNVCNWIVEQIIPLKEKREMPMKGNFECHADIISALSLADIEFIVNGRSPLTGERMSSPIDGSRYQHPAVEKSLRVPALYAIYKEHVLPPYILLKVAFALAIGCVDSQPKIACDLIFEGLYIFANAFPQLKNCPFARNAMLFLGETLEKTERYFDAALAFDVFLRTNTSDNSASADIAQIAYRNKDMLRACYHYSEAIKKAIKENNRDQALYLCNTACVIYSENGLNLTAINLYTYLLKNTYKLTVSSRRALNMPKMIDPKRSGTVRSINMPKLLSQFNYEFMPSAENINTAVSGCMCAELLIKTRMFKQADELLTAIEEKSGSALMKNVRYLRTKLYIKQNMFKEFIAYFPKEEVLRERRNSISPARTSIDAGVTFDSKTALTILLAKAYLDRNVYHLSAYWSEMLIHGANKKVYKDMGIGFYYRGLSFFQALETAKVTNGPYSMTYKFERPTQQRRYVNQDKVFTMEELASETLSSLQAAKLYFDHVGAIKKSTDSAIIFLDTALSLFFNNEKEDLTVTFSSPTLLTSGKEIVQVESPPKVTTLTKDTICDEMSVLCNVVSKNAARIMNPIHIIYSQILQARLEILKGEIKQSKIFFDYAFSNLKKYFVNGPFFLPKGFSIHVLNILVRIVSLMLETLLSYEREYINENLVLFDVFNDIQITLHNKLCNKNPDINIPLSPSINFDAAALELHNPKLPSFVELMNEMNISEENETDQMNVQRGFASYFKIINANIHLFESQKLTEDEMHEKNKQICYKVGQLAEKERRNLQHMNIVDPSFNVALKINGSFVRAVFIFRVLGNLIIYIPSTGAIRKIRLLKTETESEFSIKAQGETLSFGVSSPLGPVDFFEQMSSFIFVDKKNRDIINKKLTTKGMDEARDCIFGDLLQDENIFGIVSPSLPDDNVFDDHSFFQSNALKGALKTLAVGAPIIFYTGQDISALPLEYMFRDTFVLRAQSYTKLLLHVPPKTDIPSVLTLRYEEDRDDLLTNGILRSYDVIRESISNLGSNNIVLSQVTKLGREVPYPFPLFSSNKKLKDYEDKFEFSSFIQINPNVNVDEIPRNTLLIFTYADMVEMPELISKLMSSFFSTFFMFIPAGVVREAYQEMKLIFARQRARCAWLEKNKGAKSSGKETFIATNNVLFIGALQKTLMEKLKVPIPLFAPLGQE